MPDQSARCENRSLFYLSNPFEKVIDGVSEEVDNVQMRAFQAADLLMLDRFRGQPIALAQNVVAKLSGLTLEEVVALAIEDFAPLAEDALWEVSRASIEIGLPPDFFLRSIPHSSADVHEIPDDPG